MTQNQINFAKLQEDRRHNKATERLSSKTLKETKRHNVSTEDISSTGNLIQDWFNRQQAAHLFNADAINAGHYLRMDTESQRHNLAYEGETQRHNVELEQQDFQKLRIQGNQYLLEAERQPYVIENTKAKTESEREQAKYNKALTEYYSGDKQLIDIFTGAGKSLPGILNGIK